jgi:hypothetical protein
VAERERHARAEVAIGELLVVADIRPADAGGVDGNLKLADAGVLNCPAFLTWWLVERSRWRGKLLARETRRAKNNTKRAPDPV